MPVTPEDVDNVRFARAPMGSRGYDEVDVDTFLDQVAATLDGHGDLTAADVRRATFARAPLTRRGYDQAAVDAFLGRVENTLAARGRSPATYLAPALEHTHTRKPFWRWRGTP